ncbi:hypothetical protein [Tautonia plasticadhaerens]|uniref:Uncharacterized protein n=1 Tax=Tautonia plasticadhaerens TaxID=2527974 RepID=A0A518H4N5_9BACT|nr:hypothetical protein [Tautonia plasticadhaerens]QDV35803.1 hypothetical protein ElP_37110 [Tautonia plasticadhaerens]
MTKRPKQGRYASRGGCAMVDASGRRWEHEDPRYLRRWVSGRDQSRLLRAHPPKSPPGGEPPR